MKAIHCLSLSILLSILCAGNALAQPSRLGEGPAISVYAGGPLPVDGQAAANQDIGRVFGLIAGNGDSLYFVSYDRLWAITPDGMLTSIAGTTFGFSGDGGSAALAQLATPTDAVRDGSGNFYIADARNNRIRKVTSDGVISTVAGDGTAGFSGDGGPATAAQLSSPARIAVDPAGNLYIADQLNNRIRKVTPDGVISTIAGNGTSGFSGDGGPATAAQLFSPSGLAADQTGNLFIADVSNNRVRRVTPDGLITTFAGTGTSGFGGDGGPAAAARLTSPTDVKLDNAGNFYIADFGNNRIRKVTLDGAISTVAGKGVLGYTGDGGAATAASLSTPGSIALDAASNLYIADRGNGRIRKVTPDGTISTVAGIGTSGSSGDGGPAIAARLNTPYDVATDAAGNLYIADRGNHTVRKVTPNGVISTVAGVAGTISFNGCGNVPGGGSLLRDPSGIAVDASGALWVAETGSSDGNGAVCVVQPNGMVSPLYFPPLPPFSLPGNASRTPVGRTRSVVVDRAGNLYVTDGTPGHNLLVKLAAGGASMVNFGVSVVAPGSGGLTMDPAGNLYFGFYGDSRVRKLTPTGTITTVAGNGTSGFSGDGGSTTAAQLSQPEGLAVDAAGNLYIADALNARIRKVTSDGMITTLAAGFGNPWGVALDLAGNLYVSDISFHRIFKIAEVSEAAVSNVTAFGITNRGGTSLTSSGSASSANFGYGRIQPDSGSTTPAGVAIFAYHPGNYLVSEMGVPATATLTSGRIYAEVNSTFNTGLAIANPNNQAATINFFYTDSQGNDVGSGSTTLAPNSQIATFLDSTTFKTFSGSTFQGTFTFTANPPVAAMAIRGFRNERGDFLMSTLPVIDITTSPNSGTIVVPHFADGGGAATQILLINPTNNSLTGSVEFRNDAGALTSVAIAGQSSGTYSVPPRSSLKLATAGVGTSTTSGSLRILPANGGTAPTPLVLFSIKSGNTKVAEAGVPAASGMAFRMYVESSGIAFQPGNIQAGIAVANNASTAATVTFELTNLDGSTTGLPSPVSLQLSGFGHSGKFLSDIFQGQSLPNPFKGVVRISTAAPAGISVVGLRTHYNELSDFLITTTPPSNEAAPPRSTELLFPQLADGGGYTTQFILFSGSAGQSSSGALRLFDSSGQALNLTLH